MEQARCIECEQIFVVPRMESESNPTAAISVAVTDACIPVCISCLLKRFRLPENADLHWDSLV